MATTLPQIGTQTTDLQSLLAAFGQPSLTPSSGISSGIGQSTQSSNSNQSSQSNSSTNPAFVEEMRNLIGIIGSGSSPYSKQNAISDMSGVASNMARTALEQYMPQITAAPRLAGAYNSTTQTLMQNDLAARTTGSIASAISENINRYAGIEQGYANALANMSRAGTSQQSSSTSTGTSSSTGQSTNNQVSSQTGQGQQSNAGKAAIGGLGLNALGGLLSKVGGLAGLLGNGGQGITDILGTDGATSNWDSDMIKGLFGSAGNWGGSSDFFSGGTDLGSNVGAGIGSNGFNYGGTAGGITDIMGQTGSSSFLDSLIGGVGGAFDSISDWFSFADGGRIPGAAPKDRKKDNVPIMARSGEFVMIPEAVSALGEDFFDKINSAFMPKELKGEAKAKKSDPAGKGFATGGMVEDIIDPVTGTPTGMTRQIAGPDMGVNGALLQALGGSFNDGYSFNPTAISGAPSVNVNTPEGQAFLQAGNAMDAAWVREGVNAFLPGDINYFDLGGDKWKGVQSGETAVVNPEQGEYRKSMVDSLSKLANQLDFDISGYDLSQDAANAGSNFDEFGMGAYNDVAKLLGLPELERPKTLTTLYDDLNGQLKDFVRYRGASAGWDGSGNMRSTSETLYHNQDGKWTPISTPKSGVKREHKGWAKEEGADTIAALSVMLPAVGGFAGLVNMAGTSYAPLINAAGGYALSGNPTSLLGGLGNFGGTQLGSALGLSDSLTSVAGRLGSEFAKSLYAKSQERK